jgi:hypothetical protein
MPIAIAWPAICRVCSRNRCGQRDHCGVDGHNLCLVLAFQGSDVLLATPGEGVYRVVPLSP